MLITEIDRIYKELKRPLNIYEIGVARGMTTAFVASHIAFEKLPHKIYCIDTFSGFTKNDLAFEVIQRNKKRNELLGFSYNNFSIWKRNFSAFGFVTMLKYSPYAFALFSFVL